uniref:Thrombospondin-like N-terminal domain-containing protein n=1 Tax=Eptatretus burgeri TaxID=7764 RepID=A0A8C4R6Y3_EPTBU
PRPPSNCHEALLFLIVFLLLFHLSTAEPVDVLKVLDFASKPPGITQAIGFCSSRKDDRKVDRAFRIGKDAQLSIPTKQLFPESEFPRDFSVLLTMRVRKRTQAFLLSIYEKQGRQQLGIEVGRSPLFLYEDQNKRPPPNQYPVFKGVNLADNRWHRIAISVHKKTVTLVLDCQKNFTRPLKRSTNAQIDKNGITIFGTRLVDEAHFEVSCGRATDVSSMSNFLKDSHYLYAHPSVVKCPFLHPPPFPFPFLTLILSYLCTQHIDFPSPNSVLFIEYSRVNLYSSIGDAMMFHGVQKNEGMSCDVNTDRPSCGSISPRVPCKPNGRSKSCLYILGCLYPAACHIWAHYLFPTLPRLSPQPYDDS